MILYKNQNNNGPVKRIKLKNEPYLIINLIFTGIILLIFVYSAVFAPEKDSYPVVCIHEKITGEQCASCGLSHSFSLILRGRIAEAQEWNPYGLRAFLFFALQLVMRIVFSLFYIEKQGTQKELIIMDAAGSALLFLISFLPFMKSIFAGLVN